MDTLKHTLRLAGIAVLIFVSSSCNTTKPISLVENPPFTLGESYFQNWVAGVRGVGSGTNVHISFAEIDDDVVVKDIYFRGKKLKANNFPQFRNQYIGYGKNFMANINDSENGMEDDSPAAQELNLNEPFPFQLGDDEAVLSFSHNGRTRYYKVPQLKEKPMTAYPKSNPEGIE